MRATEFPGQASTTDERALIELELGAQYQVVRLLGRGGMGAVYLARDLALHRVVALKVLAGDTRSSDEGRERFRREARMAAQLTHPNIVPVYTFGETESETLSGPTAPATKRGRSGVRSVHASAAARARRAPSRLISAARCPRS